MTMGKILREKRRELGMTQEQMANALGVTTPAVNKWERGATCPDLALLPAVARLLKTDPNTLLGFEETLSTKEISLFLNELTACIKRDGIARGFTLAMDKTREYPSCTELLHNAALTLDGACMMSEFTAEEKRPYAETVIELYERVARSGDTAYVDRANYMQAAKWVELGEDARAQELLDRLPDWNALDKRGMQAELFQRRGETAKAGELLEHKLMMSIQDHQATLCRLIRLAVLEGNGAAAVELGTCAQRECEAFALGPYWAQIAPLEAAVARRDVEESLDKLKMLLAATETLDIGFSPLFSHLPHGNSAGSKELMRKPILTHLERDPDYAFLRDAPQFQALVEQYRQA